MNFFSKKQKIGVGIDIGTTTVKAVQLEKSQNQIFLTNYAILESLGKTNQMTHVLQTSSSNLLDSELVEYLHTLKEKVKFKTNRVHVSLPGFSAFTTLLEIPKMSQGGTTEAVTSHAEQYIPLPLTTVNLDWIKVGEGENAEGKKVQYIFLVSIPNEKIETYTQIFHKAGFIVESIEVENISAARALTYGDTKAQLIIDIGGRSTNITAAKNGVAMFSGQTDFASNSLTQSLSKALTISPIRAEKMKRLANIVDNPGSHELSTALIPIIDVILKESDRIKQGFERIYKEKIALVSLTGAGSQMPGFPQYIYKKLGVGVVHNNGLQAISVSDKLRTIKPPIATTLTIATGLALKELI